jgi:hypothetical protein
MASTLLTINTDALSRAADAILARGDTPSKNAILNALAAAIAGPGHDWGFLKNTPAGQFSQPGLLPAAESTVAEAPAKAWVLQFDERDDWARAPQLFATKEDALASIASQRSWWAHADHQDADVMEALQTTGEYTFQDEDAGDDDSSPYQIWLQEIDIEKAAEQETPSSDASSADQKSEIVVLIDSPVTYKEQGMSWDEVIFANMQTLEDFASEEEFDHHSPAWRKGLHKADDCVLKATFRPQAWIRDYAHDVDPEGETEWVINGSDLEPDQSDLDYLQTSRNAPTWVKDWAGPFEITLEITPPESN